MANPPESTPSTRNETIAPPPINSTRHDRQSLHPTCGKEILKKTCSFQSREETNCDSTQWNDLASLTPSQVIGLKGVSTSRIRGGGTSAFAPTRIITDPIEAWREFRNLPDDHWHINRIIETPVRQPRRRVRQPLIPLSPLKGSPRLNTSIATVTTHEN